MDLIIQLALICAMPTKCSMYNVNNGVIVTKNRREVFFIQKNKINYNCRMKVRVGAWPADRVMEKVFCDGTQAWPSDLKKLGEECGHGNSESPINSL